jgi:hypothetical protein
MSVKMSTTNISEERAASVFRIILVDGYQRFGGT